LELDMPMVTITVTEVEPLIITLRIIVILQNKVVFCFIWFVSIQQIPALEIRIEQWLGCGTICGFEGTELPGIVINGLVEIQKRVWNNKWTLLK
jgi:hypothetical protein